MTEWTKLKGTPADVAIKLGMITGPLVSAEADLKIYYPLMAVSLLLMMIAVGISYCVDSARLVSGPAAVAFFLLYLFAVRKLNPAIAARKLNLSGRKLQMLMGLLKVQSSGLERDSVGLEFDGSDAELVRLTPHPSFEPVTMTLDPKEWARLDGLRIEGREVQFGLRRVRQVTESITRDPQGGERLVQNLKFHDCLCLTVRSRPRNQQPLEECFGELPVPDVSLTRCERVDDELQLEVSSGTASISDVGKGWMATREDQHLFTEEQVHLLSEWMLSQTKRVDFSPGSALRV